MDQAMILQILKNNGAPPTPENMQRVLEQSAGGSRGTELLGRSMGLQGGNDESGPGMDLMLNKLMQSTARAPEAAPQINPNSESNGMPQNGAARAPAGRVEVGAPVKAPMPSRQGGYGAANSPTPNVKTAGVNSYYGSEGAPNDGGAAPEGAPNGSLDWLLAALGLSAAGSRSGAPPIANPAPQLEGPPNMERITGANPQQKLLPAPDPKLTDAGGSRMESGAPELPEKGLKKTKGMAQTPEEIARLKAEVDAENAALDTRDLKSDKGGKANSLGEAVRNFQKMFRR